MYVQVFSYLAILDAHIIVVDVVNELEVPGLDTQTGEPGAGKNFNYKIRFSNDRSRNMLGLQYRDKISTARDIVADFKSHGWIL